MYRVITISREFGSGGRTIGREVARQDYLWTVQRKIILDLAEKESCVIVGRCADYILQDRNDCLRVFIHADMQKRAERIVKVYGETDESPEKRLADKDKRRKAYYRRYGVGQVAALSPVP